MDDTLQLSPTVGDGFLARDCEEVTGHWSCGFYMHLMAQPRAVNHAISRHFYGVKYLIKTKLFRKMKT